MTALSFGSHLLLCLWAEQVSQYCCYHGLDQLHQNHCKSFVADDPLDSIFTVSIFFVGLSWKKMDGAYITNTRQGKRMGIVQSMEMGGLVGGILKFSSLSLSLWKNDACGMEAIQMCLKMKREISKRMLLLRSPIQIFHVIANFAIGLSCGLRRTLHCLRLMLFFWLDSNT